MKVEYHVEVPLSDGALLAAQLKRPDTVDRVPVLVSYYPYHKDDVIGAEFDEANSYFVENGYATLLVDMRGTGGSTGDLPAALDPQEGRDGAELVEWAAKQEWCDGNVGMWGVSYGGATALKAAALGPPSLKAIVPVLAPWDIYQDRVYPRGSRNMLAATAVWAPSMIAMGLCPPLHQDEEGKWERRWRERIESFEPHILPWSTRPANDEYWRSKAIAPADITVPMWVIGGWRDHFPGPMSQAYVQTGGPRKLLMGPWKHIQPDSAAIEPVAYLPEMLRWWERWLKGERNGVDEEPEVRFHGQRPGRWFDAPSWPPPGRTFELHLGAGNSLREEQSDDSGLARYTGDPTVGTCAGVTFPYGDDAPPDQAEDAQRSLCFTGPPVERETLIAGPPEAFVDVEVEDGADANLVVKLLDVAPDGRSALITSGHLNLRRPDGLGDVDTSVRTRVSVELADTGYLLPAGHRLAVAISTSDFPNIWPTVTNPVLSVHWGGPDGGSRIRIPVATDVEPAAPEAPDPGEDGFSLFGRSSTRLRVTRDSITEGVRVDVGSSFQLTTPEGNGEFEQDHDATMSVVANRPDGAAVRTETRIAATLGDGSRVEVETGSLASQHAIDAFGSVTRDGQRIFHRRWQASR